MSPMINKYPHDVIDTLCAIGKGISTSRRARQITQQELADRAGISRQTVIAIEKGSPEVAIGNYGAALWAMDLHRSMEKCIETDEVGVKMMESELPVRVRRF